MFPDGLENIIGTLSIGLIFLLFAMFFLYQMTFLFSKEKQTEFRVWFSAHMKTESGLFAVLLIIGAYSIGQFLEDSTDSLTDDDSKNPMARFSKVTLGSDTEHRKRAVFKFDTGQSYLSGLGKGILTNHKITDSILKAIHEDKALIELNKRLNQALNQIDLKEPLMTEKVLSESDAISTLIDNIYYRSKNWCYLQPTYFEELQGIKRRRDYDRSLFFVCAFVSFCYFFTLNIFILKKEAFKKAKRPYKKGLYQSIFFFALALILTFCASSGYRHSQLIFNERAMGYYSTHLSGPN